MEGKYMLHVFLRFYMRLAGFSAGRSVVTAEQAAAAVDCLSVCAHNKWFSMHNHYNTVFHLHVFLPYVVNLNQRCASHLQRQLGTELAAQAASTTAPLKHIGAH
jgi:hypothetical protein